MKKILVIDDEETIRLLLSALLENKYKIIEAENGEEGWHLYCTQRPDLIITDLSMPAVSGHELVKKVRETDGMVKIIAISALLHSATEIELMEQLGTNFCLAKPIDFGILEKEVTQLLGY